jgi:Family of unknown function (DUF6494)
LAPERGFKLAPMNDAVLKKAVDGFLANVNFSARREIEKVVRSAFANGKLHNGETLTTAVTLSNQKVDLDVTIFSKLEL